MAEDAGTACVRMFFCLGSDVRHSLHYRETLQEVCKHGIHVLCGTVFNMAYQIQLAVQTIRAPHVYYKYGRCVVFKGMLFWQGNELKYQTVKCNIYCMNLFRIFRAQCNQLGALQMNFYIAGVWYNAASVKGDHCDKINSYRKICLACYFSDQTTLLSCYCNILTYLQMKSQVTSIYLNSIAMHLYHYVMQNISVINEFFSFHTLMVKKLTFYFRLGSPAS